ncbi:seipin-like [Pagrus major]|uniref:seipin-like n=1 Tax=Pagrus major TaxID=143350 RepID=UPI003CC897EA
MDLESNLCQGDVGEPSLLIAQALLKLQNAVVTVVLRIRQTIIQSFVLSSVVVLLLWIAAFLYGSFYYSYMPRAAFSTPVHYHYRTDCESPSSFLCTYPVANISLMRNKKHVLTFGQAYQISLQLEMPDSPANQEQGMFMIRAACFSRDGGQVASSSRHARQQLSASSSRFGILRYQSDLLRYLGTLLFLPAFLSGAAEQKQTLDVELFSDYTDDPYTPSVTAVIEILSNKVQIYSSHLYVHAHFSGLRYLLFNFPLISAMVGVSSNFIFLSLLFILSYMRLLLKVEWSPGQLRSDGLLSAEGTNMNNNQQEDGKDSASDAEPPGPPQTTPTNVSLDGNETEVHNRQMNGQSGRNQSESINDGEVERVEGGLRKLPNATDKYTE